MARFDKLEFEPQPDDRTDPLQPERTPERDAAWWMREADAAHRRGHFESALRNFSRALEEDRSLVQGWIGQVRMLVLLEEYPEADVWSRKALELFPSHGDLLAGRAQAVCRMGDLRTAHGLCDQALAQRGESAYRWQIRGEVMLANRQPADNYCFDKAEQIERDWLVPTETAMICLHYGQPGKSLVRAARAIEWAPDAPFAWYVRGLCEARADLAAQARRSFHRCLELDPSHTSAQRSLQQLDSAGWSVGAKLRRFLWRR